MQVWNPSKPSQLAAMATAYLNKQMYQDRGNMKQMITTLNSVVHSVSNFTVFILSDGHSEMHGTPFDKEINAEYKNQSKARSSAKTPFVTTLFVRDGWYARGFVTIAGQPIPLPERTAPMLAATQLKESPKLKEPPSVAAASPVTTPPIVVAPASSEPPAAAPQPPSPVRETRPTPAPVAVTNQSTPAVQVV